jgi:hypothetical protein
MNKVYLLLRNNQQTGPYSLEELTNLPLKPFDLIWVEGKSFGWSYPGEIEALKPYVTAATGAPPPEPSPQAAIPSTPEPKPASKKIFVSLPQSAAARPVAQPQQQPQQFQPQPQPQPQPQAQASTADMLEQKAEELRKRIQSQAAESSAQPKETQTRYARSINDVEEEYTSWVFKQKAKKKKTPGVQWAAALLVLGLAGYWGWSMMAGDNATAQPQALAQSTPGQQAGEPEPASPEDDAVMSVAESLAPVDEKKKETAESPRLRQQEKKEASTLPQVQEDEPAAATTAVQEAPSPAPGTETPMENGAKEESTVSAEPKKERKKLGKAINNVLEKLKGNKQEETVEEAPKSVTGSSGERRAVRRGEDNSVVPEAPNLAAQIKLVASERPDNWMMGVVGQKLTLYNLSNQTIRSATVEVLYYNEQNKLLEKKQIQFTNIGPSRTKTLPIPDHRLADHASYKVISASGDEEAYARMR